MEIKILAVKTDIQTTISTKPTARRGCDLFFIAGLYQKENDDEVGAGTMVRSLSLSVTPIDFYPHGTRTNMTAQAIRHFEWTRFPADTLHKCSFGVFRTNESFHGTKGILCGLEATELVLALTGPLQYVVVKIVSHARG